MGCKPCAQKRREQGKELVIVAGRPVELVIEAAQEAPPEDKRQVLKGVYDFLAPSAGHGDSLGIGDTILHGVITQALARKLDFDVRFVTVDHKRGWAELSSAGLQTGDLNDDVRGEFGANSSTLNTVQFDATCIESKRNRHQQYAAHFQVQLEEVEHWERPIRKLALDKATTYFRKLREQGRIVVALCPFAARQTRTWPMRHWYQLLLAFRERKIAVIIIDHPRPGGQRSPARHLPARAYVSQEPHETAAMLSMVDLIVSADSGMAHLGGWLGTPTLALCGPTRGEVVFGGWKTVDWMRAPCHQEEGCVWLPSYGFQKWCSFGCDALENLKPADVMARALASIAKRREL